MKAYLLTLLIILTFVITNSISAQTRVNTCYKVYTVIDPSVPTLNLSSETYYAHRSNAPQINAPSHIFATK